MMILLLLLLLSLLLLLCRTTTFRSIRMHFPFLNNQSCMKIQPDPLHFSHAMFFGALEILIFHHFKKITIRCPFKRLEESVSQETFATAAKRCQPIAMRRLSPCQIQKEREREPLFCLTSQSSSPL